MSVRIAIAAVLVALSPALMAAAQSPGGAPSACAPAPRLVLEADFADPGGAFAPAGPAFRATSANFVAAYRRACRSGLVRGARLFGRRAARDRLVLHNAPDANIASIYPFEEGAGAAPYLRLEYPFVGHDGAANVPSADDLHEAIFCHVQGATEREQEEEGRCLPD